VVFPPPVEEGAGEERALLSPLAGRQTGWQKEEAEKATMEF
jgi:hypothetical protein